MSQQNTYQPAILAAIDGELAAVQAEYKDALVAAGARLQAAQQHLRGASAGGGTSAPAVEEAPAELEPDLAMALQKLETRLDQLKELRDWIKIDPELARFVARMQSARVASPAAAAVAAATPRSPISVDAPAAPAARVRGIPAAVVGVVALLALVVGWLLSLALPAASLLPR